MRRRSRFEIKASWAIDEVKKAAFQKCLQHRMFDTEMTGKPHLVFPAHKVLIMCCDCYEYGHSLFDNHRCTSAFLHREKQTISGNAKRNKKELEAVLSVQRARGWSASVIWRCEVFEETGPPMWERRARLDLAGRLNRLVRGGSLSPSATRLRL